MLKPKNLLYKVVISFCYAIMFMVVATFVYVVFDTSQKARQPRDAASDSTENLLLLGGAIQSYAHDHDGALPNMLLQKTFEQDLIPYVKDSITFTSEISPAMLQPNPTMNGLKLSDLDAKSIVVFDPTDNIDEKYGVLYGSGSVGTLTKPDLDTALRQR